MAKYVDWATINTNVETKQYGYLAFALQNAAEAVRGALDIGAEVLGAQSCLDLWGLYNDLRESALSLEEPFDIYSLIETGGRCGPPGGFAHPCSTAECVLDWMDKTGKLDTQISEEEIYEYLAFREKHEEQ